MGTFAHALMRYRLQPPRIFLDSWRVWSRNGHQICSGTSKGIASNFE